MNSNSGSGSSGTFIWGVIAGIVALIGAGGLYLSGFFGSAPQETASQPDVTVQTTELSDTVSNENEAQDTAVAEPATDETPAEQTDVASSTDTPEQTEALEQEIAAPSLDQIFVEPDGSTVLSGNAEPGTDIRVLLDGEQVHSFSVDDTGQFAEFVSIPFSDNARGLTLETGDGDQPVRSDDYLIAALPEPEPEQVEARRACERRRRHRRQRARNCRRDREKGWKAKPKKLPMQGQKHQSKRRRKQQPKRPKIIKINRFAILRSGEDGVELVQAPTSDAGAADEVALDTIRVFR